MKNQILFTAALVFLFNASIFAQYNRGQFEKEAFHKNITIELAGSHILWGLNYDMRFERGRNDGFGFKVGVGGAQVNLESEDTSLGATYLSIPVEVNYILGKRRSGLVTGLGLLTGHGKLKGQSPDDNFNFGGTGILSAYANIGYRLQPLNSGFTFQVNVNPHLFRNGALLPYFGISLGYGFK